MVDFVRNLLYIVSFREMRPFVRMRPTFFEYGDKLRVVPRFVGLLLAVVIIWFWTLLGLNVEPIGLVPETFTAIDPLVAQNVLVSAVSFENSFDFFGGVRLIRFLWSETGWAFCCFVCYLETWFNDCIPEVPGSNWVYWRQRWSNVFVFMSSTVASCLPVMASSFWIWIGSLANRKCSAMSFALSPYACLYVF